MGFGVVGLQPDRHAVRCHRLFPLALLVQGDAKPVVGPREVGVGAGSPRG